ncbi:MAG: phosphotransferase, partial [Proteobacteria bacterium]|nr:phosphotransferase [Pseudomonadota bacterium]
MNVSHSELEHILGDLLPRVIEDCDSLLKLERLSGGASQETYRITIASPEGDRLLAMRRAAGGEEGEITAQHPGLAVEALLMQVARAQGVPEPKVHYVLQPQDGIGAGFIMQWLEGEALGARIVKAPELDVVRPQLARMFGVTLARIHSIDLQATGLDQHLQHLTPEDYVRQTWERYQAFETPQPMIDFTARWLLDNLPSNYTPSLVHNDYRNGNVMVDTSGIVAVLDWEVAHIGDPMRDLGWMLTHSWRFGRAHLPVGGFGTADDFYAGYESVTGVAVDPQAVKFWQVFGSFWWAVGCLGMAEHYRNGPDQSVERPGIGRRSSECQVDCVNLLIPGPVSLVEPQTDNVYVDMPRADELLKSVTDFLREQVMSETTGRTQFLARVAGNSLDIVQREMALGETAAGQERERLRTLLASPETDLMQLREQLVQGLREGQIDLNAPGLAEHLRASIVNQINIDQPRYAGLATALNGG